MSINIFKQYLIFVQHFRIFSQLVKSVSLDFGFSTSIQASLIAIKDAWIEQLKPLIVIKGAWIAIQAPLIKQLKP